MNDHRAVIVANGPDVGSPYQRLLHDYLVQLGVNHKQFCARSFLPLTRATRASADILHLDWLHPFYTSDNPTKAIVKKAHLVTDAMLMRDIPVVWNVHNLVSHEGTAQDDDERGRMLLDRITTFVSFTQAGVEQVRDRWPLAKRRQVVVIPHGNFIGAYPNTISSLEARTRLELPDDARIALFLGRLQHYKGLDKLITAYRDVARKNDWLVVAGDPETPAMESNLLRLALGHTRIRFFFGRVSDGELQNFLNAADFCVYPFRQIFNSGAVILALSFRKAVIAPETPVLREVAGNEALIPISASLSSLKDAMRGSFESTDLPRRGESGYQWVRECNSWETVARDFQKLYMSLV
jgi:beta-1,4-mannosyltransferase